MKKHYLSPYAETVKITPPTSILTGSLDGDLGDIGEITIITDSVIEGPDNLLFF